MTAPAEIAAWLACLAFVVMLLNQGFKLKGNLNGSGAERREVTAGFEAASRRELESHQQQNSKVHDILFGKVEEVDTEVAHQVSKIGERLSAVETSVNTSTTFMRQQFADLSARLDRKIERDSHH